MTENPRATRGENRATRPAPLNWGDLLGFRVLSQELNFTRAAAILQISQPALSVRIGRLEQSLGVRLLDRTTRVTQLTDAGRLLSDWVGRLAEDWDEVRRKITEDPGKPQQSSVHPADHAPPKRP